MLSDDDKVALAEVFAGWSTMPDNLAPAVEQIVARHVAAALTEAADAIEAVNTPVYMGPKRDAYEDAARIVRNLAAKPT